MKKPFIFLLIVLILSLLLVHFFTHNIRENFNGDGDGDSGSQIPGVIKVDINSDQNNLVYQNAGTIKQQEKTITDFETSMENEIKDLSDRVNAFLKTIQTNTTNIGKNTSAIHSTTSNIHEQASAKEAQLDKAAK